MMFNGNIFDNISSGFEGLNVLLNRYNNEHDSYCDSISFWPYKTQVNKTSQLIDFG